MALTIPVTWSESHRLHAPETAMWVGAPIEEDELPARADRIRAELEGAGAPAVDAVHHDDDELVTVHDPGLVDFLPLAWDDWQEAGLAHASGQPDVVGYIFPTPGLLGRLPTVVVQEGEYVLDTVGPLVRAALEGLEAGRSA